MRSKLTQSAARMPNVPLTRCVVHLSSDVCVLEGLCKVRVCTRFLLQACGGIKGSACDNFSASLPSPPSFLYMIQPSALFPLLVLIPSYVTTLMVRISSCFWGKKSLVNK